RVRRLRVPKSPRRAGLRAEHEPAARHHRQRPHGVLLPFDEERHDSRLHIPDAGRARAVPAPLYAPTTTACDFTLESGTLHRSTMKRGRRDRARCLRNRGKILGARDARPSTERERYAHWEEPNALPSCSRSCRRPSNGCARAEQGSLTPRQLLTRGTDGPPSWLDSRGEWEDGDLPSNIGMKLTTAHTASVHC